MKNCVTFNFFTSHFCKRMDLGDSKDPNEWIPLCKRDKLSLIHILGIASGNLIIGMLWTVIFTLIEPFVSKLGISNTTKTLILLYGSFIGFTLGLIIGVVSDGLTLKFGRRRIFIISGTAIVVIALLLMMFCIEIGNALNKGHPETLQKASFIIGILLALTGGNVVYSPARTLCSDVTPPAQQSLMSNMCQVYSGFASIFSNIIGATKLYKYTKLDQEAFILVVSLAIALFAMTLQCIVTPEEPLKEKPKSTNPFVQIWSALKNVPRPFARVMPTFVFTYIATYQYQVAFSQFIAHDLFGGDNNDQGDPVLKEKYQDGLSWAMECNIVNNAVQLLYGFANSKVCEWIGMKWVMILGLALQSTALLLFFFLNNKYAYFAITAVLGLGNVIYMAVPYAIVSLCVPTEELGGNLGILNAIGVLGQQVSNFGIGTGLAKIGDTWTTARYKIGISSAFGYLGTIAAFWIIQPDIDEAGKYRPIQDSATSGTAGMSSISLIE